MLIKFINQFDDWLFKQRLFEGHFKPYDQVFVKEVANISPKKVLEIGCGRAKYHVKLVNIIKSGAIIYNAIDIDKSLHTSWDNKNGIVYKVMGASTLDFLDKEFDLVIFRGSFHEVDSTIAMKEVNRVLADEGKLLIFELTNKLLYTSHFLKNNPSIDVVIRHLKYILTENELGVNKLIHFARFLFFLLIRNIPLYKREIVAGNKFDANQYIEGVREFFDILNVKKYGELYILIIGGKKR